MARKRRHPEHANHERWLISYADFITLLFAFFTVLYATSQADLKKQESFEKSIQKQFSGFIGFGVGEKTADDNSQPQPGQLIPPVIDTFPQAGAGAGAQEVQDHVERQLKSKLTASERENLMGEVQHDAVGVKIQLASSRLFEPGSADLRADSAGALDKIGQLLKDSARKIIIEGHTDDIPIRTKEYPSNWELSAARATKIVRYLVARHKIDPALLIPIAYADQKPLAPNDSPENRAKNRRIEIKLVTGSADL